MNIKVPTIPPAVGGPASEIVKVELSKHKAVAAAVSSVVGLAALLVASGLLHGTAQDVTEGVLALLTALGVTGSVYATPVKPVSVEPVG